MLIFFALWQLCTEFLPPEYNEQIVRALGANLEESPLDKKASAQQNIGELAHDKWEDKIQEILSSSEDDSAVCLSLIGIVKQVPTASQSVIAAHITNLASDEDYKHLIPLMRDRTLGARFHQDIALDALNRPDEIKLPVMLEIAASDWHPAAEKIRDVLALILGENPGEDWDRWRELVQAKLAEPDPEKAASASPQSAIPVQP